MSIRRYIGGAVLWEMPAASFIYFTICNISFWYTAFYVTETQQIMILTSISVLLFTHVILLPTFKSTAKFKEKSINQDATDSAETPKFWQTTFFKAKFLCEIILQCIHFVFYIKFAEAAIFFGAALSTMFITEKNREMACWIAYGTLLFIMATPPWRANKFTEMIENEILTRTASTIQEFNNSIYMPLKTTVLSIMSSLIYCFYGYWRCDFPKTVYNWYLWFKLSIITPIIDFLMKIYNWTIYIICGHWIPPLINYLDKLRHKFTTYLIDNYIEPTILKANAIKQWLVYYICLHWLPPVIASLKLKIENIKNYLVYNIFEPVVSFLIETKLFLIYWLCGHWIPPLKVKMRQIIDKIIQELKMMVASPWDYFLKIVNQTVYIVTLQWVPTAWAMFNNKVLQPVLKIIDRCWLIVRYFLFGYFVIDLKNMITLQLNRLEHFLIHEILKPSWESVKERKRHFELWVRKRTLDFYNWIQSVLLYTKMKCIEYGILMRKKIIEQYFTTKKYMYFSVYLPAKRQLRRFFIKAKMYIKYRIVLPAIKNFILGTLALLEFTFGRLLIPLAELLAMLITSACQAFMDEYGYYYWNVCIGHIPDWLLPREDESFMEFLPQQSSRQGQSLLDQENNIFPYIEPDHNDVMNDSAFSSEDEEQFVKNLTIPSLDEENGFLDSDEENEMQFAPPPQQTMVVKTKKEPTIKTESDFELVD